MNELTHIIASAFAGMGLVAYFDPDHPGRSFLLLVMVGSVFLDIDHFIYSPEQIKICFVDPARCLLEGGSMFPNLTAEKRLLTHSMLGSAYTLIATRIDADHAAMVAVVVFVHLTIDIAPMV